MFDLILTVLHFVLVSGIVFVSLMVLRRSRSEKKGNQEKLS
jgi:large-conductance mechanosensitive channel